VALAALTAAAALAWRLLQPGVELATSGPLTIVRVDPAQAKVTVALASEEKSAPKTAAEWCRTRHLSVAINLGMFQNDGRANVGYCRHGAHVNNGSWNAYGAVLALGGTKAVWLDRDKVDVKSATAPFDIVVQNLRLLTTQRKNVWAANGRKWSEAAVAIDAKGRLLFLFSRQPWSMIDFNAMLLKLPLDIAGAMHVEGGPEASLSVHAGGVDFDLAGSYETGFVENDSNRAQWPIPNVIGVER
jgi:uncharacterized protein YigE (DUF2233 family)